jgi:hypothetical protein
MLWLFFIFRFVRQYVRTECRFTANDPWNQNRLTTFLLEVYALAPKHQTPRDGRLYGIRPEPDAVGRVLNVSEEVRWLPESLVWLWRDGRVPSEALPRLLHQLEPMLKWPDRNLVLTRAHILQYVLVVFLALMLLLQLFNLLGSSFDPADWIVYGVQDIVVGCLLYLLFHLRSRQKKQMKWALTHL